MNVRLKYYVAVILSVLCLPLWSQSVSVTASVDSVDLLMGDRAHIYVSVNVPSQFVSTVQLVDFPVVNKLSANDFISFHGVDVVESDSLTASTDNGVRYDFDFTVQAFDPGNISIPPFAVVPAPGADTVRSNALAFKVTAVDVDSLETINPMAPIAAADSRWYDYIPNWILWALLAIAAVAGLIAAYLMLRKRQAVIEEKKSAPVPPYDLAKQRLEKLRSQKLPENGHEKEYYTELVDILRQYLHGRFGINAMEMTSTEIVKALKSNPETRMTADEMRSVLAIADFVKFAKVRPLPDDNVKAFNKAVDFVETTKPKPPVEEEAEKEVSPKETGKPSK